MVGAAGVALPVDGFRETLGPVGVVVVADAFSVVDGVASTGSGALRLEVTAQEIPGAVGGAVRLEVTAQEIAGGCPRQRRCVGTLDGGRGRKCIYNEESAVS